MTRRLTALIVTIAFCVALAPPALAGTYEHYSLPGIDGWSPAVSAARGHVSVGAAGGGVWGGFFDRNPFEPGDLAEWAYVAPADTTAVAWRFEREVAGIGAGDWNTLFSAITDGRRRLVAYDVPSVNRGWARVDVGGLAASRLEARLVCGGPRPCQRAGAFAILRLRSARVLLHDGHAPVAAAVQGDLARDRVLAGTERLSFTASDRGGGVYRTVLTVDGRPLSAMGIDAGGGRCHDAITGGSPYQFAYRVPCPLSVGTTAALDTRRLADGRHTITVDVEDAAGNRTTVYGPTTKTIANQPQPSAPAPTAAAPTPPRSSAPRAVIHAWLERRHRRTRTTTEPYGERVRIRGRLTDAEGRPLARTPLAMTERLIDGEGAALTALIAGARWPAVTGVRTRPDGRFTAFTRVGPSRRIGIVGPGGARAPRLTLHVRAAVGATVVPLGGGALVRGRVRGSHVPRGTLVELQTRTGARWATRVVVRTRARGRFAGRLQSLPPGTRIMRARVPRQPRLPYAAGSARAR